VGELSTGETLQLSSAVGTPSLGTPAMTTTLTEGTDPDKVAADKRPTQYRIDVATITEGKLYLGNPTTGTGVEINATKNTIAAADLANLFFQADGGANGVFDGGVAIKYVAIDEDGLEDPTPGTIYLNPTNIPPDTDNSSEEIPQGETAKIPGLGGNDPDGIVDEYVVTQLPTGGILYLGDPATGGTPIVPTGSTFNPATPGTETRLTPANLNNIYFAANPGTASVPFTGSTFKYAAIDNDNVIDPEPATVTLTTPPETTGGKLPQRRESIPMVVRSSNTASPNSPTPPTVRSISVIPTFLVPARFKLQRVKI
ncbi:MAG: hypothetical protein EAZ61_14270, partial [Oscillatoriales cyanobacterium]